MKAIFTATVVFTSIVFGQSGFDRELVQLAGQRDQALAVAAEPINRRYKEGLEQLLRRATQANDLDAAIKIRAALTNVSAPAGSPTATAAAKPELTKRGLEAQLEKTSWVTDSNNWLHRMDFVDGKIIHNPKDGKGRSASFRAIDGSTISFQWDGKPATMTFSPDVSTCMRGTVKYRRWSKKDEPPQN
jgi:hypothetical protein